MTTVVRDKAFDLVTLQKLADWLAIGVAVSLPWSTSATGILIVLWLVAVLPTLSIELVRRELFTAAGGLPVLLWLLGAAGMLWASVGWAERFNGLDGFHRFLVIPVLLAQFRRSQHGDHVLFGFLISAICLLATSWAFAVIPALDGHGKMHGVPVKDYLFQSSIFIVCAFALIDAVFELRGRAMTHRKWIVAAAVVLAILFLADLAFVITSRTALVVAPLLVVVLGWHLFGLKGVLASCLAALLLVGAAWFASSYLRAQVHRSLSDFHTYVSKNEVSSTALHIEFVRKSLAIVEEAPVIGHGTGSITEEFRRAMAGETGAAGYVTENPHNQIFGVAIQLGVVGAALLVAMWVAHLMLFRGSGLTAWIGLLIVVQNVVSSLANSHLFDFSHGWLYVFGVGVAGGMGLRERDAASDAQRAMPP
jgi:O-antigen ligase